MNRVIVGLVIGLAVEIVAISIWVSYELSIPC